MKLCACAALETYLSILESWGTQKSQVLVIFVKSHKSMSSYTVSRWLKEGLPMAGFDARMRKGISTRAASTTKANVTGVPVCHIMKQ